ncbi:MAG: tRNA threonylcarbamoyladenosine biosynthesis protein TsaB [Chloroflexota bacterium]|nr:tRNA threonylcarbamoyladenosine biosynthesis protein TsaB [Chloroflexota bacterium]
MILAIDTSGGELVLALVDPSAPAGSGLVAGLAEPGGRQQARIGPAIEALVAGYGGLAVVDGVAVVAGPGSHTGLRVGLAFAAGVAFGRRLPLHPLRSLVVAAHRAEDGGGPVTALVAAGRGKVFSQRFLREAATRREAGAVTRVGLDVLDGVPPVVAEPAVVALAVAAGLPVATVRASETALAAAAREAFEAGPSVSYDELRGDYGDDVT